MAQEIEAKILNIDIQSLEAKLSEIGAERISEKLFHNTNFDYPDFSLDKRGAWVRIRDEGDKITFAYKQRLGIKDLAAGADDDGMEEHEVEVSDFETTKQILLSIGLVEKFSQEKKRITWQKDSVTFDIDTWPKIDPYLEIEADNWEAVDAAIVELGFDLKDKKICSANQVYALKGINILDYKKMSFSEFIKR